MGGQGRKTIIPLFSPKRYRKRCGLPKPLPLGEVSPKVTERASPAGKSRCAAMGRLFVRAILSQRLGFAVSILALSVGLTPASSPRGGAIGMSVRLSFVQPLSLASLDSSPGRGASGEEEKFSAMPRPPLGRSNGDDRRQWRKQGGAVGAAASRMRATAKQTLGAATRAVALRSNDGEGYREFVENARLKREEFVNVIKMRRRY